MSELFQKPPHMTYADADYLVEVIQEATRGCTREEKLEMASDWQWMADELRRVLALEGGAL